MSELKSFLFKLVSPEAELMSEPATEVGIPGTEGDFGVRAGHMALVASLRPGVVTAQPANGNPAVKYFIAGGFANVTVDTCTVLAEQAVDVLKLDAGVIANDISMLNARLQSPSDDVTAATLRGELTLAEARLKAAKSK